MVWANVKRGLAENLSSTCRLVGVLLVWDGVREGKSKGSASRWLLMGWSLAQAIEELGIGLSCHPVQEENRGVLSYGMTWFVSRE